MEPRQKEDTAMSEESRKQGTRSRVEWEHLEEWVRGQPQGFIQGVLEDEGTEFLGRRKSERRGNRGRCKKC